MKRGVIRCCLAWMLAVCLSVGCLMNGTVVRADDGEGGDATGFGIHMDFQMDDKGLITGLNPDEELQDTFTCDLYGMSFAITDNDVLQSYESLVLYDTDENEVSSDLYEISQLEWGVSEALENPEAYVNLRVKQPGTYRLALAGAPNDYKTLTVTLPVLGFYSDQNRSADTFITDAEYNADSAVYCILEIPKGQALNSEKVNFNIMPEGLSYEIKELADVSTETTKIYKITRPDNWQEDVGLWAGVELKDTVSGEIVQNPEADLNLTWKRTGLVALYEDDEVKPEQKDKWLKYADARVEDWSFLFVNTAKSDTACVMDPEDLALFYWDEDQKKFVSYEGGIALASTMTWDDGNRQLAAMRFTVDKAGIYKVVLAGEDADADGVILNMAYPDVAFYRTEAADDMLTDEFDYTDENKTFYLVTSNEVTLSNLEFYIPEISNAKAEEYVTWTESEDHKSVKITVREDITGSFSLSVRGVCQNGDETGYEFDRGIYVYDTEQGEMHVDGINSAAFEGCIISDKGYQAGNAWHARPRETYWAHGSSLQEVLDKLAKVTECANTGYYYLEMAYYAGDTVNETYASQAQKLVFPDGVKGVLLQSNGYSDVAWEKEIPDFQNDGCYPVYVDSKNNRLLCNKLEYEEDDEWYEVEKKNGIYVLKTKLEEAYDAAEFDTIWHDYEWPALTFDMTKGTTGVKLAGIWSADAGISVIYDAATDFDLHVWDTKLTKQNAGADVTVWDCEEEIEGRHSVKVSFTQDCHHTKTEIRNAVAATCTTDGYTGDTYCTTCNKLLTAGQVIKAAGHKWDAGVVTKAATATETGIRTYTCTVCHAATTQVIAATGQPATVAPTTEAPTTVQPATEAPTTEAVPQKKGSTVSDKKSGTTYKVTNASKKNAAVQYTRTKSRKAKAVKVPDTVTVNGVKYQVTSVSTNAFSANKNVETITIGKNIKSLGKNLFKKNKKLKKIKIYTTQLTDKTVKKGAFNGVGDDVVIQVPKKMLKKYKKLFVKRGLSKQVKIEAL